MGIDWKARIEKDVKENDIVLYMRGTKEAPRCGFSFRAVKVLEQLGLPFKTEDMDSDPDLWATLREVNSWRTSPQIFIKGEFIGGCDILVEMFKNKELHKMLDLPVEETV
jgi:monothiol glutaredoxin